MLRSIIKNRRLVWYFAGRQIVERYAGTWAGLLWAVLHPLVLLGIFWFVFERGLRLGAGSERPFVLDLFSALIPWMLVQESVSSATQAVTGRSYLVKRIAFPIEILPVTHVVAALITHTLLICTLLAMLVAYDRPPTLAAFSALYFLACLLVLVTAICTLVAATTVFYRDVGQVVAVLLNMWFWVTPIVWPTTLIPAGYEWVIDYNPLAYIILGYRNSLLDPAQFMPDANATLYFWIFTGTLFALSALVFDRLKPSFADVL